MKKIALGIAGLLMGAAVIAVAQAEQEKAAPAKTPVVWPAADLKWSDNPSIQGAKITTLWGDPKTSGYGALKRLPGGAPLGVHTHTLDQRVIVVSGTVLLSMDGGPAKEMGSGSYAFIPGGMKHAADCKPGADCVYFEEQEGPSDIHFVNPAKPGK